MTKGTIITLIILGILILLALFYLVRKKKRGGNACSCNCSACTLNCDKRKE